MSLKTLGITLVRCARSTAHALTQEGYVADGPFKVGDSQTSSPLRSGEEKIPKGTLAVFRYRHPDGHANPDNFAVFADEVSLSELSIRNMKAVDIESGLVAFGGGPHRLIKTIYPYSFHNKLQSRPPLVLVAEHSYGSERIEFTGISSVHGPMTCFRSIEFPENGEFTLYRQA